MVLAVEGIPGALAPLPAVGAPPLLPVLPVVDPVLVPVPLPVFAPFPDGLQAEVELSDKSMFGSARAGVAVIHPATQFRWWRQNVL